MKTLMVALLALGAALGALSLLAQSTFPIRLADSDPTQEMAFEVYPDSVQVEAVKWTVLDAAPFACLESRVGYVYLQRDVPNFTQPSHMLCMCRAIDIPTPAIYRWETVSGSMDCSQLEAPP